MVTIQRSNISGNKNKMKYAGSTTYENFSYFLGGIDVTHQNLDKITPYIQGVSRIFLHKAPPFMELLDSTMNKRFKTYIETGYKEIGGISNLSVDFTTFEGGFNNQNFQNVSVARDESSNLSISVYELTGSPVREYLDTWVTGVRDPRSGIAHYHGLIQKFYNGDSTTGMEYNERNHTAEFIYTTYDPTGLYLEYACMFAHCFPTSVPKDHLNYQSGNRENVTMQLEFAAEHYESPAINDIGIWYTENSRVNWNYLDFSPEIGNGAMTSGLSGTYEYGTNQGTYHKYDGKSVPKKNNTTNQLDPANRNIYA